MLVKLIKFKLQLNFQQQVDCFDKRFLRINLLFTCNSIGVRFSLINVWQINGKSVISLY